MRDSTRRWLAPLLMGLGVALLTYVLGVSVESQWFQTHLSERLASLGKHEAGKLPLEAAKATREEAQTSGLIGRIEIPRLGVSAMVLEGASGRALRRGVGHVASTAFPGERGNVALAGHRDTYFRKLAKTTRGDRIWLRTPDGTFQYVVQEVLIVPPKRGDLIERGHAPELTLVTCYPFHYVGPAPKRFVVRATLDKSSSETLAFLGL